MKNFIQESKNITITSPQNISSGEILALGSLVGVANADALTGEDVTVTTQGVFGFSSEVSFEVGEDVYMENGNLVKVAEGASRVGFCVGQEGKAVRVLFV